MSERIIRKYNKPKGSGEGTNYVNYNITIGGGGQNNYKYLNADQAKIGDLNADNINAMNIKTIYLMADDGTISKINGNELDYSSGHFGELRADNFHADKMDADYADIKHLVNDYMNSQHIDVKDLTVTGTAHFFQLIIDKINSVEGTQIISAAHCDIDYVEPIDSNGDIVTDENETPAAYRVYWKKSQDGKAIQNSWVENDQAIAMNFNEAQVGTNTNVSNTNYWRLVKDVCDGDERVWVNYNTGDKLYEQPDDKIKFNGFSWTRGAITDPETGETLDADSNALWTVDGQGNGIWDPAEVGEPGSEEVDTSGAGTMTANQTLLGIQIGVDNVNSPNNSNPKFVKYGTFSFTTYKSNDDPQVADEPLSTKLNVGFYYDDDFVEYFPANEYKSEYSFDLRHDADVEQIVISSAVVDEFNESWWITLGNTTAGTGANGEDYMANSTVPKAGDTIAQLGYRPSQSDSEAYAKRNCAIIIAAYETPDTGYTDQDPKLSKVAVIPPSYANYQGITTFELGKYRKTYIDASGAYIYGKLISDGGDTFDPNDGGLTIETEYYQIIASESPIIKPSSDSKTIHFTILHVNTGVGSIMNQNDLSNFTININDSSTHIQPVNGAFPYSVAYNTQLDSINVKLWYGNSLKDNIILSIIDLDDVTDGAYNQWAYRNWASGVTGPTAPTSDSNYPPTDWSATPQAITAALPYTWMTTRTVTPSDNNPYGSWSNPIRITGDNGRAGEDGDFTEFIYTRNNTGVTPSAPPASGTYPRDWPNNGTTDHQTDGNGVTWYDNPQGVESTMMYEYVSSRQYNGSTQTWTDYCTPALWAKWGENGMDGDGIKYIFTMSSGGVLDAPVFSPNGWNDVWSNRFDSNNGTKNNRHMWYDDAFNPTDEKVIDQDGDTWSNSNVLCSISKTYTKDSNNAIWWTNWSTPKIWAMYVEDGTSGATGPAGPQGDNGKEDSVNLLRGIFEVRINPHSYSATEAYENITGDVYTDVIVAVKHTVGETSTYLNASDLANYSLAISTDNTSGTHEFTSSTIVQVKVNGDNGTSSNKQYDGIRFYYTNLLSQISGTYNDYFDLHKNNRTSYMPTKLFIKLLKGTKIVDTITIDLIFKPDHVFSVGETQLNSIYQGLSGVTGVSWTTGFSQLHQDWQNINLSVNNIKKTSALQYPEDNETQKYAWLVDVKTSNPSAPTDPISYNVPAKHSYWTTSSGTTYLDSTYNGHFMSNKTRDSYFGNDGTLQYTNWSNWSKPILYATYEDGVGTTINSAQLDIKADQITSTVSATYLRQDATGVYVNQSQLRQTATGIYAGVTTDIEGKLTDTGINIETGIITLKADNTLFTGDVQVKGNIEAGIYKGLTYKDSYTSTGLQNALKTYNSGTVLSYSNYIFTGYWTSGFRYIELPPASLVEGMELNIYRYAESNDYGMLRVSILSSDHVVLPSNNNGVFSPNFITMSEKRLYAYSYNDIIYDGTVTHLDTTYTAFYVLTPGTSQITGAINYMIENKDTSNYSFGGNRYVQILNNNLTTFKAMDGAWYLTRGIATASGSN